MSASRLRVTRVGDLAQNAEHREPQRHSIDFGFSVTVMTLPVFLQHLIAYVPPDTIPRNSGFQFVLDAAQWLRYQYRAMAVSLLSSGVARRHARKLPAGLEHSQAYEVR
jgi:hypothetical protein